MAGPENNGNEHSNPMEGSSGRKRPSGNMKYGAKRKRKTAAKYTSNSRGSTHSAVVTTDLDSPDPSGDKTDMAYTFVNEEETSYQQTESVDMHNPYVSETPYSILPHSCNTVENEGGSTSATIDENSYYCSNNGKPKVLIISNDKSRQNPLPGYIHDAENLKKMWKNLKCDVTPPYANLGASSMKTTISTFSTSFKGDERFCAVFILSHGNYDRNLGEVIHGAEDNDFISVNEILRMFDNNNRKLQGIPKLFVFQCCRGVNMPPPVPTGGARSANNRSTNGELPQVSDTLIMHPTQFGDVAVVDPDGSWLIKGILNVFEKYAHCEHVADMMTRVNDKVSKQRVEHSQERDLIGVKCMSEIRSTFRKKLYIIPASNPSQNNKTDSPRPDFTMF